MSETLHGVMTKAVVAVGQTQPKECDGLAHAMAFSIIFRPQYSRFRPAPEPGGSRMRAGVDSGQVRVSSPAARPH
ncbi:hypothetical protein QFZ43_000913 [Streptomyces afghaniensis]|nr:hypothetical protein [Streptomyces afghaniensis]